MIRKVEEEKKKQQQTTHIQKQTNNTPYKHRIRTQTLSMIIPFKWCTHAPLLSIHFDFGRFLPRFLINRLLFLCSSFKLIHKNWFLFVCLVLHIKIWYLFRFGISYNKYIDKFTMFHSSLCLCRSVNITKFVSFYVRFLLLFHLYIISFLFVQQISYISSGLFTSIDDAGQSCAAFVSIFLANSQFRSWFRSVFYCDCSLLVLFIWGGGSITWMG